MLGGDGQALDSLYRSWLLASEVIGPAAAERPGRIRTGGADPDGRGGSVGGRGGSVGGGGGRLRFGVPEGGLGTGEEAGPLPPPGQQPTQ